MEQHWQIASGLTKSRLSYTPSNFLYAFSRRIACAIMLVSKKGYFKQEITKDGIDRI